MKYELYSSFRDRNIYPSPGEFLAEINTAQRNKVSAPDPVCLSAPMITWEAGSAYKLKTVSYQPVNNEYVVLVLYSYGQPLTAQDAIIDFFSGCELTTTTANPVRTTIKTSEVIAPDTLRVETDSFLTLDDVSSVLVLTDYTDYNFNHIRAPTNFDLGHHKILYNERLDSFLEIVNVDMDSRVLRTRSPPIGWAVNDPVNIRNAIPLNVFAILGATQSTITAPYFPDPELNTGNWIRFREPSYLPITEENTAKRRIVGISGQTITFYPDLQIVPPPGTVVEILEFSFDNAAPVQTYDVVKKLPLTTSLETLILPNVRYQNTNFKTISNLYVSVDNPQAPLANKYLLNSNNSYAQDGIWAVYARAYDESGSDARFIKYYTDNNPQALIINLDAALYVKVMTKDGVPIRPVISDTKAPQLPWPDLNYSVIIDFDLTGTQHPKK